MWLPPPADLRLPSDEVHVWLVALDQEPRQVELLSEAERVRAAKFHFEHHRKAYLCAHTALRSILTRYLGEPPCYGVGERGKPYLLNWPDLRFNLSHSGARGLIAVTRGREVGVDVERIRPAVIREKIADRFFAPAECDCLRALPEEEQVRGFFQCWTRKEAYIKAKGRGLAIPLDRFEVSFGAGEPRILRDLGEPDDAAGWTLWNLEPGDGYAGAVLVGGGPRPFRRFRY